MGGIITMVLAAMKGSLVAGAVLNDIGPEVGPDGLARIRDYLGRSADAADWNEAAAYVKRLNGTLFPHYGAADWEAMARRVFREDASGRPVLDYDPDIAIPVQAAGTGPAATLWPLWAGLAAKRPVLVIRGETSDLLSERTLAQMRQTAPKALFAQVPGVGHAPMLDEPAALEALTAFLAERA
jgi:pimeloyl-ACP methyl ester carboxylesterase